MFGLALALCVSTSIVWWMVLIPIALHNGYNYYKHRHHIIMKKRYSQITHYEVIIMVSILIWGIFLFFMVISFGEGSSWAAIFEIPYQLLSFMLLYSWVWRFWLIHYDTNFALCTVKIDWAIIINKRYKDLKTNWYINNKLKYGNYTWFKNHCIIPLISIQTLFIVIPIIYFAFIHSTMSQQSIWHKLQLFGSANLCFPFILLLLIYWRTPHFQDQFFVAAELKKIFIILLIKNLLTFAIFLYQIIENPSEHIDQICFFFVLNVSNGGQWYAIYIATHYVNKQVAPIIAKQQYKIMDYHTISQRKNSMPSTSIPYVRVTSTGGGSVTQQTDSYDLHTRSPHEDIKLLQLLQHIQGFEAFITHLSYEFCSECLLSFVEILQYQQFISLYMTHKSIYIDHVSSDDETAVESTVGPIVCCDYNKSLFQRITLPKQLPKSSIVYDGMDEHFTANDEPEFINMMKIKAYKLFKKYIAVGIQYQVNISYSTRRRIEKCIGCYDAFLLNDDITLNDLLFLFDKCIEEIYSLMNDSFNRFSSTPEFQNLYQLLN